VLAILLCRMAFFFFKSVLPPFVFVKPAARFCFCQRDGLFFRVPGHLCVMWLRVHDPSLPFPLNFPRSSLYFDTALNTSQINPPSHSPSCPVQSLPRECGVRRASVGGHFVPLIFCWAWSRPFEPSLTKLCPRLEFLGPSLSAPLQPTYIKASR